MLITCNQNMTQSNNSFFKQETASNEMQLTKCRSIVLNLSFNGCIVGGASL